MASANDDSPHWLHSAVEISFTLKALHKVGATLNGEIGNAAHPFVTMILDVDDDKRQIFLDAPADRVQQDRITQGGTLILRGTLDGVRVEFEVQSPRLTQFENSPAVLVKIPSRVLKVQRRGYFRVATPFDKRVTCVVALPEKITATYPVVDIGLGGVALSARDGDAKLNIGDVYEKSKIVLPDAGELEVALQVCHTATTRREHMPPVHRYGCKFVDLRTSQETLIQRYVLLIERARRALTDS